MIIDATMDVIYEQGINNFSIDDVSSRAGFSKGAFYAHFSSKEQLFPALIEHLMGQYTSKILDTPIYKTELGISPVTWLTDIASDQHDNRKNRILQIELLVRSFRNRSEDDILLDSYDHWISTIASTYRLIHKKELRSESEKILAEIGICLGHGYSLLNYAGVQLHPIREILPHFLRLIENFEEISTEGQPDR